MSKLLISVTTLAACSEPLPNIGLLDDAQAAHDTSRGPDYSCWPPVPQVPHGTARLTSYANGNVTDMPDVLRVAYGLQGGYMLYAHARMTGFEPGNPRDILDPANPFTRIRAYLDDSGRSLNMAAECAFRYSYNETSPGTFDLVYDVPIIFDICWRYDDLVGARIRVDLELMDREGHFASHSKVVTGAPPLGVPGIDYPDEAGMGGGCLEEDP